MILTFRPIDQWNHPETKARDGSPFKATYASTLKLLDRELNMLRAKNVVLQVDATERDCRLDGQLRADARLASPRVILAFDSKHGPLKYHCDRWWKWQDNLRGIALGLEAQRKLERYGITSRGEQYTGWKALGSGLAMSAGMSRQEAAIILADLGREAAADPWECSWDADGLLNSKTEAEAAFRAAAKKHHPDVGGDPALFARLTDARNVLVGSDR